MRNTIIYIITYQDTKSETLNALYSSRHFEFPILNIHNPKAPCKVSNYKVHNFKAIWTVYGTLKKAYRMAAKDN